MEKKGLVIIHTGDGKGKTTAALGLALRAWGDGLRVLILQFIKGSWTYGELTAIKKLADMEGRIEVRQCGLGFSRRNGTDEEVAAHREAAAKALSMAKQEISSERWDMVILDELNYAIKFGLVDLSDVQKLLLSRPPLMHLVITGRDAPSELIDHADLVTEMRLVRHPYQQGIKAQKGIEY